MTAHHAAPPPAWRVELIAWLRHPVASVSLWLHYWDWPVYQAWTLRQYKRADRKAFAAECDEIRAAAHVDGMTPETPAPRGCPSCVHLDYPYGCICGQWPANAPSLDPAATAPVGVPDAPAPMAGAPSPVPLTPPAGPGASPQRVTFGWQREPVAGDATEWPREGQHPYDAPAWIPVGRVTLQRPDGRITISEHGHVAVEPATGPQPVLDADTVPLKRLPSRPVGSPPWDAAPRPVGIEPQPRERVSHRGDTEGMDVTWHLARAYEQLHAPCREDSAGWGSARVRAGATA